MITQTARPQWGRSGQVGFWPAAEVEPTWANGRYRCGRAIQTEIYNCNNEGPLAQFWCSARMFAVQNTLRPVGAVERIRGVGECRSGRIPHIRSVKNVQLLIASAASSRRNFGRFSPLVFLGESPANMGGAEFVLVVGDQDFGHKVQTTSLPTGSPF